MAFDPDLLPPSVRNAFQQYGALAWVLVVQESIKAGITDANELADIVFFLHHPERWGRPLEASEFSLIHQWKSFRTLIKPLLDQAPHTTPWTKKEYRQIPKHIYALQSVVDENGIEEFAQALSKVWGDGDRWVPIKTVSALVSLVKEKCGDEGYVKTLRLGGHGCQYSFRLGNTLVNESSLPGIAKQLEEILPYFRVGASLVQLDHCRVAEDPEFVKKISRAFGRVAVLASKDDQDKIEDDYPVFEGRAIICSPNICIDVPLPNLPTRDLLEILYRNAPPAFKNWAK